MEADQGGPRATQVLGCLLGCPAELDDTTLLLKTPHSFTGRYRKIKMELRAGSFLPVGYLSHQKPFIGCGVRKAFSNLA